MLMPFQAPSRLARPVAASQDRGTAPRDTPRKILRLRLDHAADNGIRRQRNGGKRATASNQPNQNAPDAVQISRLSSLLLAYLDCRASRLRLLGSGRYDDRIGTKNRDRANEG